MSLTVNIILLVLWLIIGIIDIPKESISKASYITAWLMIIILLTAKLLNIL